MGRLGTTIVSFVNQRKKDLVAVIKKDMVLYYQKIFKNYSNLWYLY